MKKITKIFLTVSVVAFTGCKDYLDINDNPNYPLDATPQSILSGALNVTAANLTNGYNSYGCWTAGMWAKSGTVNGYNEERTYNYTSNYNQALWANTYDNLLDYKLVEQKSHEQRMLYHEAIAKIMEVLNFQLLVDEYGNIPYKDALQGSQFLTPKYDKAGDIYKDLIVKLDEAIALINTAQADATVRSVGAEDIIFKGGMANWKKFANNLKLRILMRQSEVPSLQTYITTEFTKLAASPDGFLTANILSNPGYVQSTNKQNPFWDRYRATPTGSSSTERRYQAGTQWAISQYTSKNDPRVARFYGKAASGPQVGKYYGAVLGDPTPLPGTQLSPFGPGIFKSYDMPSVIMLAAETYFLKAEAELRGFLTGTAKTDFNDGIKASFVYMYTGPTNASTTLTQTQAETDYSTYLAANATDGYVNWDVAAVDFKEKIIYQKWLALNSINGIEAWSEYRRTGFPKFPASLQSTSTRVDKLPVRLLYPTTEVSANSANLAAEGKVSQFTTNLFWDIN